MKTRNRQIVQWALVPLVFIVIGLGWKYPFLGFIVPIVMLVGMIGAFFNGRFVCGNLCPRGAFYDRILSRISFGRTIPRFLRTMVFRWIVFIALMGLMLYRILQNPDSWQHWGYVFWSLCMVTTILGIILGVFIHQRTWCAFCPIGTLAGSINRSKKQLLLDDKLCIGCRKCEKVCPFRLQILANREKGVVNNRDCLKCAECINVCPKKALCWPKKKKSTLT